MGRKRSYLLGGTFIAVGIFLLLLLAMKLREDVPSERANYDTALYLAFAALPTIGVVVFGRDVLTGRHDRGKHLSRFILCLIILLNVWLFEWYLLVDNCGAGGGCEVFREWSDGKAFLVSALTPLGIGFLTLGNLQFRGRLFF